jgi:imidazole glycerol-phosphate synthase subunit HisH
MVCVIDYGLGNIGSLVNMCRFIGMETTVGSDKDTISKSDFLILPGVGTFDKAISNVKSYGLKDFLNEEVIEKKKPILGLCLGAQIMLENSEEGELEGFGWVGGNVVKFKQASDIKIPHMGWNSLTDYDKSGLFATMPDSPPRFYFVHSYHFTIKEESDIACSSYYGNEFVSGFRKNNIFGMQFHPEKSHQFGIQFLKNFFGKQ